MKSILIIQLLVLLMVANGAPIIAKKLFGNFLSHPLDLGFHFIDGRPLLGPSKTIRGIVVALLATIAFAPLIGMHWKIGTLVAGAAMAGDLFSSFLKRRLRFAPSSMALGLDQIPESLFPLLACKKILALTEIDVIIGVVAFFTGELLLSRLLYRLNLRDQPY